MKPTTKKVWEIYVLRDPRNLEIRYVGVTNDPKSRIRKHLSVAKRERRTYKDKWICSLLNLSMFPIYETIEITENWKERECFWISEYRKSGYRLTNLTDGGEGATNRVVSNETREKIARKLRGRKMSLQNKEKLIEANTNRKWSDNQREKFILLMTGRKRKPFSEEHLRKLSISKKGKPRPDLIGKTHSEETKFKMGKSHCKMIVCKETLEVFESMKIVSEILDVKPQSISQSVCKGCSCRGFHFSYVNISMENKC